MVKKFNVIDLFAGCGGLTDGFKQSGFYNTIACVEWEKQPCRTLINRLNDKWSYQNAEEIVLHFDIQRTEELISGWSNDPLYGSHDGIKHLLKDNKTVDLVIGGPPCQAYSIAGRIRDKNGMHDDYRNYLFESYIKIVDHFHPQVFVFENVPGMLSAKPGGISIVERITKDFSDAGYEIIQNLDKNAIVDCTEYGVPQSRKRVIIVGVRRSAIKGNPQEILSDFYKEILPAYKKKVKKSVKDAIGDLPKLMPLNEPVRISGKNYSHKILHTDKVAANHIPRMHSKRDINVFKMLAFDIESGTNKYLKAEVLKELYFEQTGRQSNVHKYHVLKWDKPSNTIPAHLYKDGLRHIHPDPEQARTITVREAARLQSFDDDFVFTGSATDQYKMIGNAVPPKLGEILGEAINDFIRKYF